MFRCFTHPFLVKFLVWPSGVVLVFATLVYLGGGYAKMIEALSDLL